MENDYSEEEIKNVIFELLDIHKAKLKASELSWLKSLLATINYNPIKQSERDLLVAMYDRMGEASY